MVFLSQLGLGGSGGFFPPMIIYSSLIVFVAAVYGLVLNEYEACVYTLSILYDFSLYI